MIVYCYHSSCLSARLSGTVVRDTVAVAVATVQLDLHLQRVLRQAEAAALLSAPHLVVNTTLVGPGRNLVSRFTTAHTLPTRLSNRMIRRLYFRGDDATEPYPRWRARSARWRWRPTRPPRSSWRSRPPRRPGVTPPPPPPAHRLHIRPLWASLQPSSAPLILLPRSLRGGADCGSHACPDVMLALRHRDVRRAAGDAGARGVAGDPRARGTSGTRWCWPPACEAHQTHRCASHCVRFTAGDTRTASPRCHPDGGRGRARMCGPPRVQPSRQPRRSKHNGTPHGGRSGPCSGRGTSCPVRKAFWALTCRRTNIQNCRRQPIYDEER
jgi:hypothetical protein